MNVFKRILSASLAAIMLAGLSGGVFFYLRLRAYRAEYRQALDLSDAVVRCITRKTPPVQVQSVDDFWRTVRSGFALRRKTLVNSLQTGWQLPKEQLTPIVAACGLDPAIRGERLGLEEYARLSDALHEASK